MRLLRELSGMGSRPYPLDRERRRRVMVALAEIGLSISDLAKNLNLSKQYVSAIISGRRLSPNKTEPLIADFLGKPANELFPLRTADDIRKMREAEKKGKAA